MEQPASIVQSLAGFAYTPPTVSSMDLFFGL
jgi:hypothetical protein